MAKSYFTLLTRNAGEPWAIAFGDYKRAVVAQEREDMKDSFDNEGLSYKIIKTGDAQADIDAKVAELNAAAKS